MTCQALAAAVEAGAYTARQADTSCALAKAVAAHQPFLDRPFSDPEHIAALDAFQEAWEAAYPVCGEHLVWLSLQHETCLNAAGGAPATPPAGEAREEQR